MGAIRVDTSSYQAVHHGEPDLKNQALWTFRILDRNINFWGRYSDVVSTAQQYAQQHGLSQGTIRLLDCTGAWRGMTRH
ncbi:MAG: hypothetical protein HYV26_13830 [Candidatus Hydrogenedentes bacterium]|nr:hypothetical protein [Candidatus Hydrogenedentota bacterium]MBI3118066.1 hypothetical protein [Candidatus Hydrogenedentota bacterium]